MKRVGFVFKIKKDKIAEYKERHKSVWPEMKDALRRTGWHNYSIFLKDDGTMFGYLEADESFAASLAGMAKEPINAKWQESVLHFVDALQGVHADESMLELEEVFHLD